MKLIFIILFLFLNPLSECKDLKTIRNIFQTEVTKTQLLGMIEICKKSSCIKTVPYHAAATMKRAEFEWSPFKKIKSFNTGKKMLDDFISKYPKNIEARYIRWLTQKMAPSFLNYNKNLEDDYNYIMSNIDTSDIDMEYKKTILEHLKKINK